jgi:hypothetical protein
VAGGPREGDIVNLLQLVAHNVVDGAAALKSDDSAGAKSDTLNLKTPAAAFHVNADGTIKIRTLRNVDVTLTVKAGCTYSYGVRRVFSTGTSLTNAEFALCYGV